jgi:hypothetical protein
MFEEWFYLRSEMSEHRRNRFIGVGGLVVFFFGLIVILNNLKGTPDVLLRVVAFLCGVFCLVTIALMLYYPVKFIWVGVVYFRRRVSSSKEGLPDAAEESNLSIFSPGLKRHSPKEGKPFTP